mmetsp:Transcript_14553/g.26368  ORF Transcript_14553/g.26368 Transcript_14553/m.26368 type:complete len:125 (-) Transcript_14553:507-881(-)
MITEAGAVFDLFNRVNYDMTQFPIHTEKLSFLNKIAINHPSYAMFGDSSIPEDVIKFAGTQNRSNMPFNFTVPSDVHVSWRNEIKSRGLSGVGNELTKKRKSDIFIEVVRAIKKKLVKGRSLSK